MAQTNLFFNDKVHSYARSFASNLVAVQPMSAPSGVLFYFDPITKKEIPILDLKSYIDEILQKLKRVIARHGTDQTNIPLVIIRKAVVYPNSIPLSTWREIEEKICIYD